MYGEDAVLKVEWINKLHDMGFSFPDIKNFLVSFQEIKSGPELMHTLRSLYQEKLAETNETIHRLQQLSSELQYSINYMDVCNNCEPTTSSSECKSCQKHSEDSSPLLVSIVTNAV
jgi:MerR family copper efflux transcriptional regulator